MATINFRAIKLNPCKHNNTWVYVDELNQDEFLKYFVTTCDRDWHYACGRSDLYNRAKSYKEDKEWETDEEVEFIDALNALGEGEFVVRSINGSCQGDYGHLYINKECLNMVDYIESVFFGTGTEVKVDSLDEDYPLWFYTEKWGDDDILEEASEHIGCSVDEIILLDEDDPRASERFTSDEYQEFEETVSGVSTSDLVNLLKLLEEKGIEDERMTFLKKAVADLKTDKVCPHCGETLYKSDLPQYRYVCPFCEENFFAVEV